MIVSPFYSWLGLIGLIGNLFLVSVAHTSSPINDQQVLAIARELKCPVCQNLSAADSPSEMAQDMRRIIADKLHQGESPEAIKAYFKSRYGSWIDMNPPTHGLSLMLWLSPLAALLLGVWLIVKRIASSPKSPENQGV